MGFCPCFGSRKKGASVTLNLMMVDEEAAADRAIEEEAALTSVFTPSFTSVKMPEAALIEKARPCKDVTFSYRELAAATNNFCSDYLIGEGGFGPVYQGKLQSTGQVVAVKKLNASGSQGSKEFLVEVLMFSLLRHPNLIDFVGFCAEGDERLLVYQLLPLGSLDYHLHDLTPDMKPLDWNTRMKIAAGVAQGLDYLHNQADPPVIHRDLKSANILLGEGFHPKLADFGLAKFGPTEGKSHVSTRVMGTHGYCAPEYYDTGKLTSKSDVYCFGILLLEIITGRRPLDKTEEHGKHTLLEWARPLLKDSKNLGRLADQRLKGEFSESVLRHAVEVALSCLQDEPRSRPSMREVVGAMKYLTTRNGGRCKGERVSGDQGGKHEEDASPDTRISTLNKYQERERAVAEAKQWAETCRAKAHLCGQRGA